MDNSLWNGLIPNKNWCMKNRMYSEMSCMNTVLLCDETSDLKGNSQASGDITNMVYRPIVWIGCLQQEKVHSIDRKWYECVWTLNIREGKFPVKCLGWSMTTTNKQTTTLGQD